MNHLREEGNNLLPFDFFKCVKDWFRLTGLRGEQEVRRLGTLRMPPKQTMWNDVGGRHRCETSGKSGRRGEGRRREGEGQTGTTD